MQYLSNTIKKYLKLTHKKSILQTRPLKKIPEYLCWKTPKKNTYFLFNKEGRLAGRMVAYKDYCTENDVFYPTKMSYASFYIKRIFIEQEFRQKGACKAFLNIAAKESYRNHCDGKVHLIAKDISGTGFHPQIIYRKYGFDSQNKYHIQNIDSAILNSSPLPKGIKWETPMFLCRLIRKPYN